MGAILPREKADGYQSQLSTAIMYGVLQSVQAFTRYCEGLTSRLLKGSWDLVTRVITKVTVLTITYNST